MDKSYIKERNLRLKFVNNSLNFCAMRIYIVYFLFWCLIFTICMMEIHSTYVREKIFHSFGIFIYLDSCWWGKELGQGNRSPANASSICILFFVSNNSPDQIFCSFYGFSGSNPIQRLIYFIVPLSFKHI